jgi:hypothetical protein
MGLVILDGECTSGAGDKDTVRRMTETSLPFAVKLGLGVAGRTAVAAVAAETSLPFAVKLGLGVAGRTAVAAVAAETSLLFATELGLGEAGRTASSSLSESDQRSGISLLIK